MKESIEEYKKIYNDARYKASIDSHAKENTTLKSEVA
jgi:hypothetical protein